jgi:large subunit ribosomal protein L2
MSTIKHYKPTTPARRKTSTIDFRKILTGDKPTKNLIVRKARTGGRNNRGVITTRHIGGGARKMVRMVDYKNNFTKGFKVNTIEYDPGRTAFICLVTDLADGSKKYILHTKGIVAGKIYGVSKDLDKGTPVKLSEAPIAAQVSQIELRPGQGAKIIRSAGTYGTIITKDDDFVSIKMPSGEVRRFSALCRCVIGQVGNDAWEQVRLGSAGRNRRFGVRPTVRGKVMNPVDHPHGGGEARNSIGMKAPKTPWGRPANGVKTRSPKKTSNAMIISRRPRGRFVGGKK